MRTNLDRNRSTDEAAIDEVTGATAQSDIRSMSRVPQRELLHSRESTAYFARELRKMSEQDYADLVDLLMNGTQVVRGCWIHESTKANEYRSMRLSGHSISAHRLSYLMRYGAYPEGRILHHSCRVKGCYRPTHLIPVTNKEHWRIHNVIDKLDEARGIKGLKYPWMLAKKILGI